MSCAAFNKIDQTKHLFKKIIAPLKQLWGLSFGYMIVFNDGSYYTISDNEKCLKEFVTYVDKSHIFCDRNVTNYLDKEYNFTLWPKVPVCSAMEIYYQHNIWNGVTISKISENYTQLYWFTGGTTRSDWHKFFIRSKQILLEFINYFESYKELLFLPKDNIQQDLFKFNKGFITKLPKSIYIQEESGSIKKFIQLLHSNSISMQAFQLDTNLSLREVEVLAMMCHGFTAKIIACKLEISIKTVQQYVERIKHKTGLHFKTDLIEFYENNFHKTT